MFRPSRRRVDGFSLIELMVAVSIMVVVFAMAGDYLFVVINQHNIARERDQLSREARFALDDLLHDLRSASTGDPAIDPVANLAASSMTFYSPDRATPEHMRTIAYKLTGTNLQRSITTSTNTAVPWTYPATPGAYVTVIPDVQSFAFTYYDNTGTITAATSKVQKVGIAMVVDNDPAHSPWNQVFNLSVELRITNV